MVVYHLATLYPWFHYSMAVYATHNVFLVLADCFLMGMGVFGLLIGFQVGSFKENQKITSFIHTGGSMFGIPSILFIICTQGAIEFSLWNFYQTVLPYKLKTSMPDTTKVTNTMINTFTYLDPSFAFLFSLILAVVWIVLLVGAVSNLKSSNSALFDGTGSPLRNTVPSTDSSVSFEAGVDKVSTVSYASYPIN